MRGKADGKGMWEERPGEIDEVNGDQGGGGEILGKRDKKRGGEEWGQCLGSNDGE
jgi:hypothetical protein